MKLLYVTSEAYPFCKTGGLADVAGSLPPALAAEGVETAVILPLYDTAGHALRDAVFQVTSVFSTSGFSTTDYNLWPHFAKTNHVLRMYVGGRSSSPAR